MVMPNKDQMENYQWRTKGRGPKNTHATLTLPVACGTQLLRVIVVREETELCTVLGESVCSLYVVLKGKRMKHS